jgi:hypothetical protein
VSNRTRPRNSAGRKRRLKRLRLGSAAVCAGLATPVAVLGGPAIGAPAAPAAHAAQSFAGYTNSVYMKYWDQTSMQNLGCNDASAMKNQGMNYGYVEIDFGAQQYPGYWATKSPFTGSTVSDLVPIADAGWFSAGFAYCASAANFHPTIYLGLGTNNSYSSTTTNAAGQEWATVVKNGQTQVNNAGAGGYATVVGANDIEQWNDSTVVPLLAAGWATGFNTNGGGVYFNFGSADGCPDIYSSNAGQYGAACPALSKYDTRWTVGWYYQLSWGLPAAFATPEIYVSESAPQWKNISNSGHNAGYSYINFVGTLASYPQTPGSLSPQAAWNALQSLVNQNLLAASNLLTQS